MVATHKPGTPVKLTLLHEKQRREVEVTLAALNDDGERAGRARDGSGGRQGQPSTALGIAVANEDGHVVVEAVTPDGPAEGKLRPGDVIEEIDHQPVATATELTSKLAATPADKPVLLHVKRGDQSRYVAIERGTAN